MTIELTRTDCKTIEKFAVYAIDYLKMKRDALIETKTDDVGELESVAGELKVAEDIKTMFYRLAFTDELIGRCGGVK